jgi:arylsulfatase A-like enzyme
MENATNIIVNQPNIILITVDQLRFPMNLPPKDPSNPAVKLTPDEFVEKYMPNLWKYLWQPGVKFSNYYTAASDCTAARATIHTGLYAYQTYSMLTLITFPPDEPTQPALHKDFPTIGHLMRDAGYATPYFGKWHLSYDVADLEKYGYTSHTPNQDYVGYAGEGQATDDSPAYEAAHWINENVRKAKEKSNTHPAYVPQPFFLNLNFVNPHDKQWYWGGMEANDFYEVYNAVKKSYPNEVPPGPYIEISPQDDPSTVYDIEIDGAIPNFQDQNALNSKPRTQTLVKEVFQYQMGGIYEEDQNQKQNYTRVNSGDFFYADAPSHKPDHKAIAPHRYWSRALDSYVQLMTMVDRSIGNFMKSISEEVRQNAIFVFTSDHGEYGSSHGLQGKGGTVYEEGIRVPLIVRDSRSNGYAKNPELVRKQLSSSVDLLRMIVTMGNGGTTAWMTGDAKYQQLYGNRWDLLSILASNSALGRTYALHSTDEFIPDAYNFNQSPLHVLGLIQTNPDGSNKTKLGVYTTWQDDSASPTQATVINPMTQNPQQFQNMEFYDQTQELLEKDSNPTSTEAQAANKLLFGTLLSTEMQATLPTQTLRDAQTLAYQQLLKYMAEVNKIATPTESSTAAPAEEVQRLLARAWAF